MGIMGDMGGLREMGVPKPLLSKAVGSTTIGWCTKSFWQHLFTKRCEKRKDKLKKIKL